jgi:outer membrane receptor protein involved in Fe transport
LGRSLTEVESQTFSSGTRTSITRVVYDNELQSIELRGDGTLASLPGGDVGLALGAGYRGFSLGAESRRYIGASTVNLLDIDHKENVAFAFGEIAIPLFGPDNSRPLLDFLQFTGAVRYERYDELASVASPKLGFIYRPTAAVTVRGGWGKSFKAPTFYQRYKTYQALLLPAALLGATGSTASRPVLYVAGGNADLQPERASVWNISVSYEPPAIPSLRFEANYYNVRYRNRVADPIASVLGVLSNPAYASLVTFDPSETMLDRLIAPASALGLQNITGRPYDPSTVYAVVDARANNTAYQSAEGVDLSARYRVDLNSGGHIDFTAGASYIESERRLIKTEDPAPFAGVIFRSPHWRARGGATFEQDNVALSAFLQYTGGVTDDRIEPHVRVGSFLAADLSARLSGSAGIWRGIDLTLTVSNLFNEMPDRIRSRSAIDPGYDSTNYSVLGRTISVTLAKRW